MINRKIKLIVATVGLCIALFLLLMGIGCMGKDSKTPSKSDYSEETSQDTEGIIETEYLGTENQSTEEVTDEMQEYINFAIADVTNYVNVRKEPNTESEILGKIFDGAVAQIMNTVGEGDDMWFQIISGNVEGFIKAEFFIHGEEAAAVMDKYVSKYIIVKADRLNVREAQSTDSRRIGYVCTGEELKLIEDCGEWIRVQYTDEIQAYVSAQYVTIHEEYIYAKTPEDERAEQDFIKELKDRAGISEEVVKEETTITVKPPSETYTTNTELRKAIVNYAMQYLGNRYIHGGQSLKKGTDCSGFTMYVLKEFGYSISRTPQGQFTGAGRKISYSEVQPGDIICYSSNGGKSCTHVAFYIGDGKILHAANSRDGVKISSATYDDIIGVRNVID